VGIDRSIIEIIRPAHSERGSP